MTGPSPDGLVPPAHLPVKSPPAYLLASAPVMDIRGGIRRGSVVGRDGSGTPGSESSGWAHPSPGPDERRRRGRLRSAPNMLALPGSGVSRDLCGGTPVGWGCGLDCKI